MSSALPHSADTSRPFVISRLFDAPREHVWRAWTDPEQLRQWFAPAGFTLPTCTMDLRPGGVFHYALRSPDGHETRGKWIFREIAPPEKLVVVAFSDAAGGVTRQPMSATWPLETLSQTTFAADGEGTRLTIEWRSLNATATERRTFDASHDGMRQGLTGTLDQLARHLSLR